MPVCENQRKRCSPTAVRSAHGGATSSHLAELEDWRFAERSASRALRVCAEIPGGVRGAQVPALLKSIEIPPAQTPFSKGGKYEKNIAFATQPLRSVRVYFIRGPGYNSFFERRKTGWTLLRTYRLKVIKVALVADLDYYGALGRVAARGESHLAGNPVEILYVG